MRRVLPAVMSLIMTGCCLPLSAMAASQPDVNFKIYSPAPDPAPKEDAGGNAATGAETPVMDDTPDTSAADSGTAKPVQTAPPEADSSAPAADAASSKDAGQAANQTSTAPAETQAASDLQTSGESAATESSADGTKAQSGAADGEKVANKILQGYIRVVPAHTKIPIIMDTAVDSDTSQEGDEFSARTGEDLTIDGQVVVPAGSVIKGRIAQLNAPKRLDRSGSVALKFDTVTTPDNRQIPLVATIVAHGGVVHARRGAKDIVLDAGIVTLPTVLGLGIGALAGGGSSANKVGGRAGAAMIGAAVGVAIGTIIICTKKGKKVDVRPGDELKIELGEDLRMPMGG